MRPLAEETDVYNSSRTVGEVRQSAQYLDDLGRPMQTVAKNMSPAGFDVVSLFFRRNVSCKANV